MALFAFCLTSPIAQAETYNFYTSSGGLKPFYWQEDGENKGIIPDLVESIKDVKLNFITVPRKRIDRFIQNGRLDMIMLHPDYTEVDDLLSFIPLQFSQKNVLFQNTRNFYNFNSINDVRDVSICARHGYVYINMGDRWDRQSLRREDLKTNENIMRMLDLNRCHFAIGSSLSLKYLIKVEKLENIKETSILVNEVPRYLAVANTHPELIKKLNDHIYNLNMSGEMDKILQKYAP